ncbi:MAG: ROK family protein [Ilumatobacter sp.]|nr:ROK family protein [Ilumatobacter sp.]
MSKTTITGTRSESVRLMNQSVVLRAVHLAGESSRSMLVPATGLTRGAVGTIVGDLVDLRLLEEERAGSDGSPGRPSTLVRPSPRAVVVAFDIRVETVAVGVFTLGGHRLAATRISRDHDRGPEHTVDEVATIARGLLELLPPDTVVHGVGAAVAGLVRQHDQLVVSGPNLGWRDVPIGALLRDRLGADVHVAVGNDGDLGALAETRRGAAVGLADVVYLSGEVGIGGGVIAGGRPLTGSAGCSGEVGHIPVNPDGLPCNCGSSGCWETEAGDHALLRRVGRSDEIGTAAIEAVVHDAEAGDAAVLAALDEHARWVAFGLAGVMNTFDPDLVVLGGTLARIHPYIAEAVDRELDRRVFDVIRAHARVVPSELGIDAMLTGAAEWAWESVLTEPPRAASGVAASTILRRSA